MSSYSRPSDKYHLISYLLVHSQVLSQPWQSRFAASRRSIAASIGISISLSLSLSLCAACEVKRIETRKEVEEPGTLESHFNLSQCVFLERVDDLKQPSSARFLKQPSSLINGSFVGRFPSLAPKTRPLAPLALRPVTHLVLFRPLDRHPGHRSIDSGWARGLGHPAAVATRREFGKRFRLEPSFAEEAPMNSSAAARAVRGEVGNSRSAARGSIWICSGANSKRRLVWSKNASNIPTPLSSGLSSECFHQPASFCERIL